MGPLQHTSLDCRSARARSKARALGRCARVATLVKGDLSNPGVCSQCWLCAATTALVSALLVVLLLVLAPGRGSGSKSW